MTQPQPVQSPLQFRNFKLTLAARLGALGAQVPRSQFAIQVEKLLREYSSRLEPASIDDYQQALEECYMRSVNAHITSQDRKWLMDMIPPLTPSDCTKTVSC